MANNRSEITAYFDNISILILSIVLIAFPLVFSSATTDLFSIPKQVVLGVGSLLTLLVIGAKLINEGHVRLRRTPFDLPIFLFGVIVLVSCFFSRNMWDALISFIPLLFAIFAFYAIINAARSEKSILALLGSLIVGAVLVSLNTLLSYFKIYVLPFQYTHTQTFTPLGSLLDQAIYLGVVLIVSGYFAYYTMAPMFKASRGRVDVKSFGFGIAALIIAIGFVATVIELFTIQKPLILPFIYGFQTGFASISQDATRLIRSFLFGSGYGTYLTDFTRFKAVTYNADQTLWSFTFFRSSSYVLELLATTGVLGLLAFLFLIYRIVKQKPNKHEGSLGLFAAVIAGIVAAFLLPLSFVTVAVLFIVLALFSAVQGVTQPNKVYDLSLALVAFRKLNLFSGDASQERSFDRILPSIYFVIILIVTLVLAFYGYKYIRSDMLFQQSLVAASQNDLKDTFDLEVQAIQTFDKRDAYHRIFSQTSLTAANAIAAAQPKGSSPSAQVQQQILGLVQQSINSGRQAVAISPLTSLNWQNLSSIYRALIGFGQNADQFAIAANQQAIALDQNNPQEYINLGGIYYQLGQWDNAIQQFQTAARLKPDFANAYYNWGHALESKGDLQTALAAYQTVKQLVANDPTNSKKISDEIKALQDKIGSQGKQPSQTVQPSQQNQPLGVPTPEAQLPERNPKVAIPTPGVTAPVKVTPQVKPSPSL